MVFATGAEERAIPGNCTDAAIVSAQGPQQSIFRRVPYLQFAWVIAYSEEVAIAAILYASYAFIGAQVA